MKPSLRILVLFFVLAVLPASAFAVRSASGDSLAQVSRSLRVGDRGEQVAHLQQLLQDRGFNPGPIDGSFGPRTLNAVRAAQSHYNLEVDGLAGRLTIGALRSDTGGGAAAAEPVLPAESGLVFYRAGEGQAESAQQGRPVLSAGDSTTRQAIDPLIQAVGSLLPASVPAMAPSGQASASASTAPKGGDLALTFNGLPEEAALDAILKALEARGAVATFFVSGEAAERQPELVKRIDQAGHEVASLGYTELDMRRISPMTARALVRRTQSAILEATGKEPAFFRPPLGRFDQRLTTLVEEEGLRLMLWSNVAVRPVPEMDSQRLVEQLGGTLFPRAVIMLPLDKPNVRQAVEPLLAKLEAEGYRSRSLSELMGAKGL